MKQLFYMIAFLSLLLTACGPTVTAAPSTATATPAVPSPSPVVASATPQPIPTVIIPSGESGPTDFPPNVNPLTGLQVADPSILDRRPLLVKVSNLPRNVRPQWGLSLADIVFEYYTEEGSTRFAAVFYGNNADMVGPIRSGRFIDGHLTRGYKAVFAFGSAYVAEMDRFLSSEYADRLVIEGSSTPLTRYDPNGYDYLVVNTSALSAYATKAGIQNRRQNLDGMSFKPASIAGGKDGKQAIVRYSASIYNRWDYDTASGKYLRFSESTDDFDNLKEQYTQLTDRLTNRPLAFDNVVFLYVNHELYSPGIYDILFSGSGDGFAFRDGQAYPVSWQRGNTDVVSLTNPNGTPFPFKPGNTWFEVIGLSSTVQQSDQGWRFTHQMP